MGPVPCTFTLVYSYWRDQTQCKCLMSDFNELGWVGTFFWEGLFDPPIVILGGFAFKMYRVGLVILKKKQVFWLGRW